MTIEVMINDKDKILLPATIGYMVRFEQEFGKPVFKALSESSDDPLILIKVAYSMAFRKPEKTFEDFCDEIEPSCMFRIAEAVRKQLSAMSDPAKAEKLKN